MFKTVRLNAQTYPIEPAECAELERAEAEWVAIEGQQPEEIVQAVADCDALLVVSSGVPANTHRKMPRWVVSGWMWRRT